MWGANYVRVARGGRDNGLGNLGEKLGIANANDHGPGLLALNILAARLILSAVAISATQSFLPTPCFSTKMMSSLPTGATCSTLDFNSGGSASTLMKQAPTAEPDL